MDWEGWLVVFFAVLVLGGLGYAMWIGAKSPSLVLKESEWECVEHETYWMPMMVGKTTMLRLQTRCVALRRK